MATPKCLKVVVYNDTLKKENKFVTYIPLKSQETTCSLKLSALSEEYKNIFKKSKRNWMKLWTLLDVLALEKASSIPELQSMHHLLILKEIYSKCRLE